MEKVAVLVAPELVAMLLDKALDQLVGRLVRASEYVVVGQLEQANFTGAGLDKFPLLVGDLWNPVFKTGQTTIYEVIR